MDKVDYLWLIISKFDGWALIGAWADIGTNTVQCTTYDVLGISALISGAIFVENKFFSKSETAYFSALFHKKIIPKE